MKSALFITLLFFILLTAAAIKGRSAQAQVPPLYPAQVFDLVNWKLTLPSGTEGSPDEISSTQLQTYTSEHFKLNPAKIAILFTAKTNGVTTANSNYPRSELRERVSSGSANAAWSPNDGKSHSMLVDETIMNAPKVKPSVVAGQIHDGTTDVMVIRYDGKGTGAAKGLHINAHTGPNNQGSVDIPLNANYKLGTRFKVKFEVLANNPGKTDVYYNNKKVYTLNRNYGPTAYFKAGVYPQSSCIINPLEDCNSFGRVAIYNLIVCHNNVCTGGKK